MQVTSANLERSYRRAPKGAKEGDDGEGAAGICHLCLGGHSFDWENLTLVCIYMESFPGTCAKYSCIYTRIHIYIYILYIYIYIYILVYIYILYIYGPCSDPLCISDMYIYIYICVY